MYFDWESACRRPDGSLRDDDEYYTDAFLAACAASDINPTHPDYDADNWHQAISCAVAQVMGSEDLGQTLARLFLRLYVEFMPAGDDPPHNDVPDEWRDWAYESDADALVPYARRLRDGSWSR